MEIKYGAHVPTEEYGYISFEIEGGEVIEVVKKYCEIKKELQVQYDITPKLIEMINSFSVGEPAMLEDYENLSEEQKKIVQAIKKAYNRSPMAKEKVEPRIIKEEK